MAKRLGELAGSTSVIDVAELYRAEAKPLYRFALFLSGDPALAEDLVSETFIRLWTARERVDLSTVKGYLFTIARNLYLHQLRRRPSVSLDDGLIDQIPDLHEGALQSAIVRQELRSTLIALQELPEVDRAALLMRADDELSYDEIGAALGLTAGAVRVKVHRARLRLAAARVAATSPSQSSEPGQEASR